MLGSIAASVEVDNFVDGSLHHSHQRQCIYTSSLVVIQSLIALPLGWGICCNV
ncbi:MAG: hypothetical protein P0116_04305 [Candidatus Nitrosocosmicus sp.]|nr:hypothetical protein [Candidatus Nitrosocosmicus sp.]